MIDYLSPGLLWSVYSVRKHVKLHGYNFWPVLFVLIFNLFLWPIGMCVAIFRAE